MINTITEILTTMINTITEILKILFNPPEAVIQVYVQNLELLCMQLEQLCVLVDDTCGQCPNFINLRGVSSVLSKLTL
jgi:hypothetical protein